jgi:secondary thiamine-phosphate synthase enzyme
VLHLQSSLMGASLTIPVRHGRLALGTWQGIYLNEHRNYGGPRTIVVTVQGMKRADGRKYPAAGAR